MRVVIQMHEQQTMSGTTAARNRERGGGDGSLDSDRTTRRCGTEVVRDGLVAGTVHLEKERSVVFLVEDLPYRGLHEMTHLMEGK